MKKVGVEKVALITGEEKIIPSTANYFICTAESMPKEKVVEFVAIDEIQMCADKKEVIYLLKDYFSHEVKNLQCS